MLFLSPPGTKAGFAAVDFKTVAMAVPVYDGVPVCIGSLRYPSTGCWSRFCSAAVICGHGEVESAIHRGKVVAANTASSGRFFAAAVPLTVDNAVEVVLCH